MDITTIVLGLGVLFVSITFYALIDIAKKEFGSMEMKAFWVFTTALIPFIGVVIYFLFGYKKGKQPNPAEDISPKNV